jgi:hypothetical protein
VEEIFPNKRILEKLTKEGKSLAFYTTINKAKTLKHLITCSNLITYINLKSMIDMPIIGCHV